MDAFPGQLFVAAGAVIAALIAGAFSYFNLVSSKEVKVSEFRQEWINALRVEISIYVSSMQALITLGAYIHSSAVKYKHNIDILREKSRLYEEALGAYNSIHLRVNQNEKDKNAKRINDNFILAIEQVKLCYETGAQDDLEFHLEQVIAKASPLLKHEWNRVRDGEPSYRWAKRSAVILVCAAILAFGGFVYVLLPAKSLSAEEKHDSPPIARTPALPETQRTEASPHP